MLSDSERDLEMNNNENEDAALSADVLHEDELLERISDELPEMTTKEIITAAIQMGFSKHFRGPLPPPDMLAEYEKIQPGFADRIVSMAEKQQNHRISIERSVVDTNNENSRIGLYIGGAIGIIGVTGSLIIVALGHPVSGLAALFLALASLAGVYFKGLHEKQQAVKKQETEETEKARDNEDEDDD